MIIIVIQGLNFKFKFKIVLKFEKVVFYILLQVLIYLILREYEDIFLGEHEHT